MGKILILDGNNILHRMFNALPKTIIGKNNRPINAVVGFIGHYLKLSKKFNPDYVAIIFDSEDSLKTRKKLDHNYKGNRITDYGLFDSRDNPYEQLQDIKIVLKYLRISHYEIKNYEADDVIAHIAQKYSSSHKLLIATTDQDLYQLLSPNVKIIKSLTKSYDLKSFYQFFPFKPNLWIDYKALIGDVSDNIKGIKGIGKATANKLISEFSTIESIYINLDHIDEKIKKKLQGFQNQVIKNKQLLSFLEVKDIEIVLDMIRSPKINNCRTMDILKQCDIT